MRVGPLYGVDALSSKNLSVLLSLPDVLAVTVL